MGSMYQPTFLVTNDDGIRVFFLRALVEALSEIGTVYVAAPKQEQSWVGRKVSRHQDVTVTPYHGFSGIQAWEIDGTPTDAVNIALGNLLPIQPDVVVSGINVGFNAFLPVLYSSGTVAGALEGAGWGIPAVALSIHLLTDDFQQVKDDQANPPESVKTTVTTAAKLGAQFASKKVGESNLSCLVDNVNFPARVQSDSPWIETQPGRIQINGFFEKSKQDTFKFRYMERTPIDSPTNLPSDWDTFTNGKISHSRLNFHDIS